MLHDFAAGYYISTYWVERTKQDDEASMNQSEYELLKHKYNDVPLLMKIQNNYFEIRPDSSLPARTLRVSDQYLSDSKFDRNPSKEKILVPKPSIVRNILI